MAGAAGPNESSGVADAADPEGTVNGANEVEAELAVVVTAGDEDEADETASLKLERRAASDLEEALVARAVLAAPLPRFLRGLLRTLEAQLEN